MSYNWILFNTCTGEVVGNGRGGFGDYDSAEKAGRRAVVELSSLPAHDEVAILIVSG